MTEDIITAGQDLTEEQRTELKTMLERHSLWIRTQTDDAATGYIQEGQRIDIEDPKHGQEHARILFKYRHYLEGADLRGANLPGVDFYEANLKGVDFRGANLSGSAFSYANLDDAQLQGADLSGTSFLGVNFQKINLEGVTLYGGTDLEGADLTGVNLKGMNLRGVRLNEARIDKDTKLCGAILPIDAFTWGTPRRSTDPIDLSNPGPPGGIGLIFTGDPPENPEEFLRDVKIFTHCYIGQGADGSHYVRVAAKPVLEKEKKGQIVVKIQPTEETCPTSSDRQVVSLQEARTAQENSVLIDLKGEHPGYYNYNPNPS